MMMAVAKRALELNARTRDGLWHDRTSPLPRELAGSTVLVIGFGRIGSRTAPRCAAMGMQVLVFDPKVAPVPYILEGRKGEKTRNVEVFDLNSRSRLDTEITKRTLAFIQKETRDRKPFFA